jgi:hypothetical protein
MKTITPSEMIEWFEAKSEEFRRIAQTLRATFNSEGQPSIQVTSPAIEADKIFARLDADSIKTVLNSFPSKAARHTKIAQALHANAEYVRKILVDNPNDFEMKGRGWWMVKKSQ